MSAFSLKLTFSQYSAPGSGVMAGSAIANSRSCRGAMSSSGSGPDATVAPFFVTSHAPSADVLAFTKSNQFFTLNLPGGEVDRRGVHVAVDVLDREQPGVRLPVGADQAVLAEVVVVVDCRPVLPPAAVGQERLVGPPAGWYAAGTGCRIPWSTQSHTKAPCALVPE